MRTIFLCAVALLLTACACTKNSKPVINEPLPPATETGANTFGCVLNGRVFIPNKAQSLYPDRAISVFGYYDNTENSSVRIYAKRGHLPTSIMSISLYLFQVNIKKEGEYLLGESIKNVNTYYQPFNNYIICNAKGSSSGTWKSFGSFENSGRIILTRWDDEGLILSGTFSGKLKEIDGEEIIEIKDGRFDLNLKTLQP